MTNKPEDAMQYEPIPKGWRLVPEEPTPAMIVSGVNASGSKDVVVMYKAMIAESSISNTTEWVGLTDEEIIEWVESGEYNVTTNDWASHIEFARAIETKLKEKNR
jgi:hypothetical protein